MKPRKIKAWEGKRKVAKVVRRPKGRKTVYVGES